MTPQAIVIPAKSVTLSAKELARELKRSAWYVCAMRRAGYQFLCGKMTPSEHALAWLAQKHHFRSTDYATQTHRRSRRRRADVDKSGAQSH